MGGDDGGSRGVDLKQYSYKATSNLVLRQERRGRRAATGSDDVQPLRVGALEGMMGDRSRVDPADRPSRKRQAPAEDADVDPATRPPTAPPRRKRRLAEGVAKDVVAAAEELGLDAGQMRYIPKTQVSQMAFEGILAFIMTKMGDMPRDVLRDAAEEALQTLKTQTMRETERKARIEELMSCKMTEDEYARLSTFGRQIKDFGDDAEPVANSTEQSGRDGSRRAAIAEGDADGDGTTAAEEDMIDEDQGVAVVFDDEDDADEVGVMAQRGLGAMDDIQYLDKVVDAEDASSDDGAAHLSRPEAEAAVGPNGDDAQDDDGALRVRVADGTRNGGDKDANGSDVAHSDERDSDADDVPMKEYPGPVTDMFAVEETPAEKNRQSAAVDVGSIDAFWLQRQLSKYYSDAEECQKTAEGVFKELCSPGTDRSLENRLVMLLGYDKFDLVKILIQRRKLIVFCMRRARAATPEERFAIEAEMETDPSLTEAIRSSNSTSSKSDPKPVKRRPRRAAVPTAAAVAEKVALDSFKALKKDKGFGASAVLPSSLRLRKLDLADLAFSQGGHLMSVKECRLPGSVHSTYKDYEEWHVPATRAVEGTDVAQGQIRVSALPEWAQPVFQNTKAFNRVQSKVFRCAFESDENMLLCAPTGAGKTNVAVLTILRAVSNAMLRTSSITEVDLGSFKIIYVAPMKALVSEVVANLGTRLEVLGLAVRELTGDINLSRREIDETQVIVTTPEKWDIITRKAGERTFTSLVRLVIVDEIHLLHDDRGPVLEAIIARTVRSVETTAAETRLVGLSATLPNYRDVAAFMRVDPDKGLFHFDSSYRPCPLQQCFVGITTRKALKRFQLMNELTYEKVKSQVDAGNQVIVFVHSRKDTGLTARLLVEKAIDDEVIDRFMVPGSASHEIVRSELSDVQSKELASLLENGVAIHHAGLSRNDRTLVEDIFAARHVKVLVSTATLAWGVNLPAHAVIIRGTQVYSPAHGRWVELSPMDVMQMMGRAGRPQHDTQGEGFIITTKAEVLFYLSVLNQQLPIESQMISRLCDTVNAEVAIGTVSSVAEGSTWLGYTYLYVRMLRHPTLYGVSIDEKEADPSLERRRLDLMHSACLVLDEAGLIKYDKTTGRLKATDLGRVAADFYIGHETMAVYAQHLKPSLSDIDLLRLFALSGEFKYMRVREEEKLELVRLADRVPIPVKESLDQPSAKVNILLQAYVSNLKLDGLALASDMIYVTQSAGRLARALLQIAIGRRWVNLVDRCLTLSKMVAKRQWTSQTPLRQFLPAVSDDVLRRMERIDMDFDRYYDLTAAETGELLRNPKLGKVVHRLVHSLPRLDLEISRVQPITRSMIRIEVTLTPDFRFNASVHGFGEAFWVWVEDADSERLLHVEPFYLRASLAGEHEHALSFVVPMSSPIPPQYFIRCVSDRWITPDTVVPVSFRNLILPSKFPPYTEPLDLQPLAFSDAFSEGQELRADDVAGVEDKDAYLEALRGLRRVFSESFEHLNSLQTQAFPALFKSDKNCVIAAAAGTGRLVCAELALARLFARNPTSRAVFIVGRGDVVVKRRLEELQLRLGRALALEIGELTGESSVDLALLKTPGIVLVSTPERWDMLSRRWQRKKEGQAISKVGLIVLDDAHLIGENADRGCVLEVLGSRMRYISAQAAALMEEPKASGRAAGEAPPCRIVAVMDSVSNARDVGQWLGAPSSNVISFHPSVRPVPVPVHVEPVVFRAGGGVAGSAASLVRPVYQAIRKHVAGSADGVVVFVASRRLARAMALELVMAVAGEGTPDLFVSNSEFDLAAVQKSVGVATLRECLRRGVGYVHETLAASDCEVVERMYRDSVAQVLVSTPQYAWKSGSVGGRVVVLAGTSAEEAGGYALSRAEYPLSEISHMIGRAGRQRDGTPLREGKGSCVLITEPALRDYYRRLTKDALPVESHLDAVLPDQINAEVGSGVIQTKQQAVDYLTWTFFYRRLPQNPNFYNMAGNSHRFIQDHLSDLVERSLSDLEASKCVATVGEEDMALGSLNLGMIASHYYIKHSSIELFASSISARTKIRGLLDIVASASEFDNLPVRIGEEASLEKLSLRVPVPLTSSEGGSAPSFSDPHVKAHLLLQSHLVRIPLAGDLVDDRDVVVSEVARLLRALVDVTSSAGWLKPALKAMELSQLFIQGMWESDAAVAQLPHMTPEVVSKLKAEFDVDTVDGLLEMDDDERSKALSDLSRSEVSDVARACNEFPDIQDVVAEVAQSEVVAGKGTTVFVVLERGVVDDEDAPKPRGKKQSIPVVSSPRYPKPKEEGWWLVIGVPSENALLGLKYVTFGSRQRVRIDITVPNAPGKYTAELYLMSDSYVDCDQQDAFEITVLGGDEANVGSYNSAS